MDIPGPIQQFKLRTLTPLWLGDIDRNSGVPKESGLLGSLRFWYEGLLRSHGIHACDPTGEGKERCEGYDCCDACMLFGATGYARRFRLEVEGLGPTGLFFTVSQAMAGASGRFLWRIFGGEETGGKRWKDKEGNVTFEFGVKALWSPKPFTITLYARPPDQEWVIPRIAFLLQIVSRMGGIGAKTQYGFGQVKLEPDERVEALASKGQQSLKKHPPENRFGEAFTLHPDRFFTLLYKSNDDPYQPPQNIGTRPTDCGGMYVPCAFDIRLAKDVGLRPTIASKLEEPFARNLFGFFPTKRENGKKGQGQPYSCEPSASPDSGRTLSLEDGVTPSKRRN